MAKKIFRMEENEQSAPSSADFSAAGDSSNITTTSAAASADVAAPAKNNRTKELSDRYTADLLVKTLLKKEKTPAVKAPSSAKVKAASPPSAPGAAQKAAVNKAAAEGKPAPVPAKAAAPAEPPKTDAVPVAADTPKKLVPDKKDRTKAASDRYSADLLIQNILRGKNSKLPATPSAAPQADEAPAEKKIFRATPVEGTEPAAPEPEPQPAPKQAKAEKRTKKEPKPIQVKEDLPATLIVAPDTTDAPSAKKIFRATPADGIEPAAAEAAPLSPQESATAKKRAKKETEPSETKPDLPTTPSAAPDAGEAPPVKKIFRIAPAEGTEPAAPEPEPQPAQKPVAAEKQSKKEPDRVERKEQSAPAAAADVPDKKQPKRIVRVLKTIYRAAATMFKVLFLIVPLLGTMAYTNMHVDPGRLYHIDREDMFEYDIVRILKEGHNVENIDNYNERLVKRDFINRMEQPADVIIAGSSRGALITKDMLGVASMFNTSVAGGSLDDVIGFYGVLKQYDLLPKTYIIVFDPWMLNDNYYESRYERSLGDGYYNYMTNDMGYTVDESLKVIDSIYEPGSDAPISFWDLGDDVKWNLLSITYFQASIQRHFNKEAVVRPDTWPVATDAEGGESAYLRPDGSFCYPLSYREADAEKASHRARMSLPNNIIGLEDYEEMDSRSKQKLIDFINCVKRDGVEVKLVIEPISTVLYDYMTNFERYENFFKVEEMLYEIAASLGVDITGTFNPETLEYDMNAFYDGYHLREEFIEEIIKPFKA